MIKKLYLVFMCLAAASIVPLYAGGSRENEKPAAKEFARVTDHRNRTVVIPAQPQRIVAPFYILSNTALAIGCRENIVSGDGGKGGRSFIKEFAPELAEKPVCGSAKKLNLEALASVDPDLILVPFKAAQQLPQIEALGVPALVIEPESMANFFSYVEMLGKATGKDKEAHKLLTFYKEILADVAGFIKDEPKVSVYMSSRSDPLNALSPKMFQAELVAAAGGTLVSGDIEGVYWTKVSLEQVQKYAPAVIVMANGAKTTAEELRAQAEWKGIPAVDSGSIYIFPSLVDEWDSPIPASCLGVIWLADKLHPGKIPAGYLAEKTALFYKEFFGKEKTLENVCTQ
ncbi:MAG: ABC transporter substrate-binding protein [Treponema sp.]